MDEANVPGNIERRFHGILYQWYMNKTLKQHIREVAVIRCDQTVPLKVSRLK